MIKLPKNKANYAQLTPLSFLYRTVRIYPNKIAWVYGRRKENYKVFYEKCKSLAIAIKKTNIKKGDVVSVMLPNIPEMIESHFGIPMSGAILNCINTRLEKKSIEFILKHSKTKILIYHEDYTELIESLSHTINLKLVLVKDEKSKFKKNILGYDNFLKSASKIEIETFSDYYPEDEWDSISLNYTSGTTGSPKGVLYHHRGANLMCFNNQMVWKMSYHPIYLWTLPMFHCNGWCFPWTIVALAGTQICLKKFTGKDIIKLIDSKNVTHLCGAPIILQMIIESKKYRKTNNVINVMTAASPPSPNTLEDIEESGFSVTHVYGLTESYGPAVVCEWQEEWNKIKSSKKRSLLKARQGVNYPSLDYLDVYDFKKKKPVRRDGKMLGEVRFKGNIIMKGYLNNAKANQEAFKKGWFYTGDLAVVHSDGYIELKDRSKDIIISGGENISSIEIEKTILLNKSVTDCAVIGIKDMKWGEVPCAFLELKKKNISEKEIINFCKKRLAGFKVPKKIIFMKLPRTSTGKIKKFDLRRMVEINAK